MSYFYEGRATALLKEAAEKGKKDKKLNFSEGEKMMLSTSGTKGAQDEINGRPGEQRMGVIVRNVGSGALLGAGLGAIIASVPKMQEISTTLSDGSIGTVRAKVPPSLKSIGQGTLVGGAIGATTLGALGSKAYSIGADFQKTRQGNKKKS